MNLLVTGGAGFIGSNFIRQRLLEKGSPLTKLVNLDALTYAGNPANLADLAIRPALRFRPRRHRRHRPRHQAPRRAPDRRRREFRRRVPRRPFHRFPRAVFPDQRRRHAPPPQLREGPLVEAPRAARRAPFVSSTFRPTKFTARSPPPMPRGTRNARTSPTPPTPPPRPPATTSSARSSTLTICPPSPPTAPTITAPIISRRS
jgi:hypothetical protein